MTQTQPTTYAEYLKWRFVMHHKFLVGHIIPKISAGQTIRIGTHNKTFHADEVMAVVMMRMLITKLGGEHTIHRVDRKDQDMLDSMDVLLDVGCELDPENGRFDHHQPDGTLYRIKPHSQIGMPLSTCGLVWHAVGLVLADEAENATPASADTRAFFKVDRDVAQGVDASDNGVLMPNGYSFKHPERGHQELPGKPMHLSQIIGMFNGGDIHNAELQFQKFSMALDMAQAVLKNSLADAKTFAKARPKLETALKQDRLWPEVLVLHEHIRWTEHIGHADKSDSVKIVIAPTGGEHDHWNVHIVSRNGHPTLPGPPDNWRGLRGGELSSTAGIAGLEFCHNGGHLIVTRSKEVALEVAKMLLQNTKKTAA